MPIYDKPTKTLMREFADEKLAVGKVFHPQEAVTWFNAHYPRINHGTVKLHVEGMATNNEGLRRHHRNIKPGSGHDLFFKLGTGRFRLYQPDQDPPPYYVAGDNSNDAGQDEDASIDNETNEDQAGEFAFERDLRNYLARNITKIESGLKLYEEEGISGVEFPVGGRFIDILAVDSSGRFVVIELKVSRGYDRTIGQLLRYMGWIDANFASGEKCRGFIVAKEITQDLKLAASRIADVGLVEYELALTVKKVA